MLAVAKAVVIAALAGLIAGCIAFAVTPVLDPLRLSDRGRQAYVYAAEALAAAIGLHVWLTMPWLFQGYLIDYWMLIVMAVAFLGRGWANGSIAAARRSSRSPWRSTALVLPLLPAIGFWIAPMRRSPQSVAPGRPCAGGVVPDGHALWRPDGHATFVEVCGAGRPDGQSGPVGRPGTVAIPLPA